jgi:hypothetical protein
MARKPYLEFSVEDRHVSSRLYRHGVKNGWFDPPDKSAGCAACTQGSGPIERHREDYSQIEPNDSLVILCYRCHRVVHMRDRYPDGWEYYRTKVREGWRWDWAKDIGPVASDMRSQREPDRKVREALDRTPLDDIHDGTLLAGTPEDRQERLQKLYAMWAEVKNGGQASLF